MKKTILTLILLGFFGIIIAQNDYLTNDLIPTESLPKGIAKIFKKGIISLPKSNEHTCSFSPDGNIIYFTRDPDRKTFVLLKNKSKWTEPIPANFNGREAVFSPDGSKIFFGDGDIWFIEKKDDNWTEPQKLSSNINTDSYEFYASSTQDGTIYFSRFVDGQTKIFNSTFFDGKYTEVEELPSPINQDSSNNFHPFISPQGDYIIFNSDRSGGFGGADLYISYKDLNNKWEEPINLGNKINSEIRDICPTITPDGKYLFFTRNWQEDGKWYGDIYWIDTFFLK